MFDTYTLAAYRAFVSGSVASIIKRGCREFDTGSFLQAACTGKVSEYCTALDLAGYNDSALLCKELAKADDKTISMLGVGRRKYVTRIDKVFNSVASGDVVVVFELLSGGVTELHIKEYSDSAYSYRNSSDIQIIRVIDTSFPVLLIYDGGNRFTMLYRRLPHLSRQIDVTIPVERITNIKAMNEVMDMSRHDIERVLNEEEPEFMKTLYNSGVGISYFPIRSFTKTNSTKVILSHFNQLIRLKASKSDIKLLQTAFTSDSTPCVLLYEENGNGRLLF